MTQSDIKHYHKPTQKTAKTKQNDTDRHKKDTKREKGIQSDKK